MIETLRKASAVGIAISLLVADTAQANNFEKVRDMMLSATGAAIEYHCDGYQMSAHIKQLYEHFDKVLESGSTDFRAWQSMMDEVEDRYGLHTDSKAGCLKVLKDWGPRSADPLVVKDE